MMEEEEVVMLKILKSHKGSIVGPLQFTVHMNYIKAVTSVTYIKNLNFYVYFTVFNAIE